MVRVAIASVSVRSAVGIGISVVSTAVVVVGVSLGFSLTLGDLVGNSILVGIGVAKVVAVVECVRAGVLVSQSVVGVGHNGSLHNSTSLHSGNGGNGGGNGGNSGDWLHNIVVVGGIGVSGIASIPVVVGVA